MNLLKASMVLLLFLLPGTLLTAAHNSAISAPAPDVNPPAAPEPVALNEPRHGDTTTVTLEIPASGDTFTASGKPTINFSSDVSLRVGFNVAQGNGAQRVFLFFSLSSIPPSATIQSARLRLHQSSFSPTGDASMGMLARVLSTPWDPSLLTWANYNPSWGAEIGIGMVPAASGWIETSITSIAQDWLSGDRANYGLMIQGDETPQQRERVFTSINANDGLHPRLVVTYETSPGDTYHAFAPVVLNKPLACWPGSNEAEPNNTAPTANGPICPGAAISGLPNDQWDMYYLEKTRAGDITTTLTNYFGDGMQLHLYYGAIGGSPSFLDTEDSDGLQATLRGAQPGRYYIAIYTETPNPVETRRYRLQVSSP